MLSPYARIMLNAQRGNGMKLSAEEVYQMARDTAIIDRGEPDLEEVGYMELPKEPCGTQWIKIRGSNPDADC